MGQKSTTAVLQNKGNWQCIGQIPSNIFLTEVIDMPRKQPEKTVIHGTNLLKSREPFEIDGYYVRPEVNRKVYEDIAKIWLCMHARLEEEKQQQGS